MSYPFCVVDDSLKYQFVDRFKIEYYHDSDGREWADILDRYNNKFISDQFGVEKSRLSQVDQPKQLNLILIMQYLNFEDYMYNAILYEYLANKRINF